MPGSRRHDGQDPEASRLPGAENYASWFDAFAEAGGAPANGARLFHQISASDGAAGFARILEDILLERGNPCDIAVPQVPTLDQESIHVAIDCALVPRSTASTAGAPPTENWSVDPSTNPPTVRLLGQACTLAQQAARIDVIVVCESSL